MHTYAFKRPPPLLFVTALQLGSNSGARDSIMAAAAEGRRHESRVRTFPHVEGMYPTLVMVPGAWGSTFLAFKSCPLIFQEDGRCHAGVHCK
eukprot:1159109-Pelagomonas_calceolata.AAC.6